MKAGSETLRSPLRFALELALLVAVAAGGLEAAIQHGVLFGVFGRPVMGDARLGWIAPLSYFALLVGPAILVGLALRSLRPAIRIAGMAALLFGGLYGLALLQPNLHKGALAVLSAGVAVQAARVLARRLPAVERATRRAAPVAVGVVALYGGAVEVVGRWTEAGRLAALRPAEAGSPNVLLIVWDTVRAKSLSLYGYGRPTTPELDRLARRGVTFDWAWAPAPWTLPSHASLFTGRLQEEIVAGPRTPMTAQFPTLAEALAERGYLTAGFVANSEYCGRQYGIDRGFQHYEDYVVTPPLVAASAAPLRELMKKKWVKNLVNYRLKPEHKRTERINTDFLEWVDGRSEARPFFAFLNTYDAHDPYHPPAPFDTMFGGRPKRGDAPVRQWRYPHVTPERVRLEEAAYEGGIRYMDRELAALLQGLETRGLLANTLVIVTSDHGEHFGEHNRFFHGTSLYEELLRVPLLMILPGRLPADQRVATHVSLRDLAATILDVVGSGRGGGEGEGGAHRVAGTSLRETWNGTSPEWIRPIYAGLTDPTHTDSHAIIAGDRYYIDWLEKKEEFYDLDVDPGLLTDVSADSTRQAELGWYRGQRDSLRALGRARPQRVR